MSEVLLINPNMVFPSDYSVSGRTVQIRDIEKVINLGLLSIASYLDAKNISVRLIDLVGKKNDVQMLRDALEQEKPKFVGISCISCYAYLKVIEYAEIIKSVDKDIFVMSGGQHISGIPHIAMQESPHLDCVVKGEGETAAYQIISNLKQEKSLTNLPSILYRNKGELTDNLALPFEKVDLDKLPFLKYTMYPDFREFSPHVEESRWCPFRCNFCTSGVMSDGIRYKSMSRFVDEVAYVASLYSGEKDLRFFFACSAFGLQRKRIEEFISLMKEKNLGIKWRTETRSDSPVGDYLDELAEVGLSVIDLGLESGSPTMLKLMNKCRNTDEYLLKASDFIARAGRLKDVLLKVNLVFYAGETPTTIKETIDYLFDHAGSIDTMSAGPVMLYSGVPMADLMPNYIKEYGTEIIGGEFWDKVHAYPVNPSSHFSFDQLNEFALTLAKMLCPEREYFEVKKYGQFPLKMTFDDFRKEVSPIRADQLPFNRSGDTEIRKARKQALASVNHRKLYN